MQRPNTVLGLIQKLVRTRWEQLSPRGRTAVFVGGILLAIGGLNGARMALGGSCGGACPSMRAAHHASADGEPSSTGCPFSR